MNEAQAIDHGAKQRHDVAVTIDTTRFGDLQHILTIRKRAALRTHGEVGEGLYQQVVDYCDDQLKIILGLK